MIANILSHEIFCMIAQGEASVKQCGEKLVLSCKGSAPKQ
jgi:hypothetical protein